MSNGLLQGLRNASLSPLLIYDCNSVDVELPTLVVYPDPLGSFCCASSAREIINYEQVLSFVSVMERFGCNFRLVNINCSSLPKLIAWCVDLRAPFSEECTHYFTNPEPFGALHALDWLRMHPEQNQLYQALESHPLAAALDGRPPDLDCLGRYRQAANLDALLAARQEQAALEADLVELAQQLQPLQQQQLEALALREQLALLQGRLQQADVLQERCSELQLSLQAQQLDLEQLARRLALLEQLVSSSSEASLRLQSRLAQALA